MPLHKRKTMRKLKAGTKSGVKSAKKSFVKSAKKILVKSAKKSIKMTIAPYHLQQYEKIPKPDSFQREFLEIANKPMNTKEELIEIQREYRAKGLQQSEQSWADTNFNSIVDLMGEKGIWEFMVPSIHGRGWEEGRASSRKVPPSDRPVAIFSGAHWTSRKAGETEFFDPYYEYQIPGTNQFCQTFALMYLLDRLPEPIVSDPRDISKYYHYTRAAIEFIIDVFTRYPFAGATQDDRDYNREYYLSRANNCLKNSNACLNIIEMPKE